MIRVSQVNSLQSREIKPSFHNPNNVLAVFLIKLDAPEEYVCCIHSEGSAQRQKVYKRIGLCLLVNRILAHQVLHKESATYECDLILCFSDPHGLTFMWWGCCGLCLT